MLSKYSPKGIKAIKFDPDSIMLYAFDVELFSDDRGPTNENVQLSATDQTIIKQIYPT